jgi:hypothetical protein
MSGECHAVGMIESLVTTIVVTWQQVNDFKPLDCSIFINKRKNFYHKIRFYRGALNELSEIAQQVFESLMMRKRRRKIGENGFGKIIVCRYDRIFFSFAVVSPMLINSTRTRWRT